MSEVIIKDATGSGKTVGVDGDNRILATAKSESLQAWNSTNKEQTYQVRGETTLASGTVTAMHLKNISTDKVMVITYIRHQIVSPSGGTAIPNTSNYFRVGCNTTRASGGTQAIPVNVHVGSNNLAQVDAYVANPTTGGDVVVFDRWYTQSDADMNPYAKDGSLQIDPAESLELAYVGDQIGGIIETRVSFVMEEKKK